MSLFKKASEFAKSPQGKKALDQAKRYASDPKTKSKLNELKKKFTGGKQSRQLPTADSQRVGSRLARTSAATLTSSCTSPRAMTKSALNEPHLVPRARATRSVALVLVALVHVGASARGAVRVAVQVRSDLRTLFHECGFTWSSQMLAAYVQHGTKLEIADLCEQLHCGDHAESVDL